MRVLLTILSLSWLLAFGQFPQVKEGHKNMLFLNATAFVEGERVINKAAVGVKDGVITLVENALSYTPDKSEWDTIIDMKGYTMYPGFISANNTLGLTEIDAVRATNDFRETAAYSPEIESYVAFNTQSEVIYTVRTNGVLISQATPRARRIGGQSSMLRLNAWNYEDALIRKNDGMHIYWPTFMKRWGHKPGEPAFNKKYEEQVRELKSFLEKAKAYELSTKHEVDQQMEAFLGVFKGEKRLYLHANGMTEINDIIDLVEELRPEFPVLVGGYDSYRLIERLKYVKMPVMLDRPHSLPMYEDDDVEAWYLLPMALYQNGIEFCIQNHGDMEAMNARNLPFLAGTARAYGLPDKEAINSISLNVAKITGIDSQYGSIAVGKSATFFFSTGDPLDMVGNSLVAAYIDGNPIDLTNRQIKLADIYARKYEIEIEGK